MLSEREQALWQDEIVEANLTMLVLAQRLYNADPSMASYMLGVSTEVASAISGLKSHQLLQVARTRTCLATLRFSDAGDVARAAATDAKTAHHALHQAILLASEAIDEAAALDNAAAKEVSNG